MGSIKEDIKKKFEQHCKNFQERLVIELKNHDPKLSVVEDIWERCDVRGEPGGGGRTLALNGEIFEGGGVNTSTVWGAIDPQFAKTLKAGVPSIWATGVSIIIHPKSPRIPTIHGNFRLIENGSALWFGGGVDLTPYYPYPEDFSSFHQIWKDALAPYGLYEEMKESCDQYFVNHHRNGEMRGIGGIFFDHFYSGDLTRDFHMVAQLSDQFIPSYFSIVERRKSESYDERDEDFQLHRRGRYVEFNLLHDRGTLFGLRTNGRVDSILISLPPRCRYSYCYQPASGSLHEEMLSYYYPRKW